MTVLPLPPYLASNLVEADWVMVCLRQQGIEATLLGQTLLGAVGELPANGLLRIAIEDHQVANVKIVLDDLASLKRVNAVVLPSSEFGYGAV
jgi:hypothetical protein